MKSRTVVNLGLFIFLTVTISLFIYKKNTPEKANYLTSLDPQHITSIHIPRPKGMDIKFKKNKTGNWYMMTPFLIKAHAFRIKTLLSISQLTIDKSYNIDELNPADYQLSPPLARIIFNKDAEIAFGKTNPVNNKRYLLSNKKMTLVKENIYPLVSAQAVSFIDLSLLPDDVKITQIKTPGIVITKDSNKEWKSSGDNKLNADQIQGLLQNWKQAKAFAVHKFMPRKHLGRLEITDNDKIITYEITEDDSLLILAAPNVGIEYHLDISHKESLLGFAKAKSNDA